MFEVLASILLSGGCVRCVRVSRLFCSQKAHITSKVLAEYSDVKEAAAEEAAMAGVQIDESGEVRPAGGAGAEIASTRCIGC